MTKIKRIIVGLVSALALVGLLNVFPATNYRAEAVARDDLIITNKSGERLMNTCKDWSFNDGRTKSSTCPSPTCVIYGGQNTQSKCGWSDTDGVYVTKGFRLMESITGADRLILSCAKSAGYWGKVTPTIGITGIDHTRTFYLNAC